jgi:acyl-CoA thioesterase-1
LAAALTARADVPVILVLGDSLSSAHGMATNDGWVDLMDRRLETENYPYRIVNASVGGETTGGGRARLPAALRTHRPEIVVLELGGNDGLLGFPITELQANLDLLVQMSMDTGAQVLLVGMMIPPNYGPVYAEQFASAFSAIAERYQLPLVPFLLEGVALNPALMQADGIHPTAAAQPRLLETVWAELEPLLVDKPTHASATDQ